MIAHDNNPKGAGKDWFIFCLQQCIGVAIRDIQKILHCYEETKFNSERAGNNDSTCSLQTRKNLLESVYIYEGNHSKGHAFSNASCCLRHKSNSFVL